MGSNRATIRPRRGRTPKAATAPQMEPLIDTREQLPYELPGAKFQRLETGDYSLSGAAGESFRVERKTVPDLLGCIGRSRERFERELERLAPFNRAYLLVEGTLAQIADPLSWRSPSSVHPSSVIGSLLAWEHRYGVRVVYAGERAYARAWLLRMMARVHGDWLASQGWGPRGLGGK